MVEVPFLLFFVGAGKSSAAVRSTLVEAVDAEPSDVQLHGCVRNH